MSLFICLLHDVFMFGIVIEISKQHSKYNKRMPVSESIKNQL